MPKAYFIITISIIFLIVLGLIIFFVVRFFQIPQTPSTPISDTVTCEPDRILEAWIRDFPDRRRCPPFTNNYIIATDKIQMFEKNFKVDSETQCCWFSNQVNQRTPFPNPWICISREDGKPFTLDELNQKPYAFANNVTNFLIPPCESDLRECIGLIRFDTSGENALYKIFLFFGSKSDLSIDTQIINQLDAGNFIDASFEDTIFVIGKDCSNLVEVFIKNTKVVETRDGRPEFLVDQDELPDYVVRITDLFRDGRFYPIAGANPQLSENAADTGTTTIP